MEYNSLSKDTQGFHIQFKPSYVPDVPYYEEKFVKTWKAHFPIGLYCDIQDSNGVYHRWLIVDQYKEYSIQFPSWIVLPCDFKAQWVYKNTKYESWGVLRSQNSYNSGLWRDFKLESPENQKILWLPMNDITKTLYYNQRMIISEPIEEPITWRISKPENMNVRGINRLTFAQDEFNPHTDFIEKDSEGNVVGMWADYFNSQVTPANPINPADYNCIVTTDGQLKIKIGGAAKIFKVNFVHDNEEMPLQSGTWSYTVNGVDVSEHLTIESEDNQTSVQFAEVDEYIGEKLTVTYTTEDNISGSIDVNIVG